MFQLAAQEVDGPWMLLKVLEAQTCLFAFSLVISSRGGQGEHSIRPTMALRARLQPAGSGRSIRRHVGAGSGPKESAAKADEQSLCHFMLPLVLMYSPL